MGLLTKPKANQVEMNWNLVSKIPICLAKNCRKKNFIGNYHAIADHVVCPDWTSRALVLPTRLTRIAIRRR